MLSLLPGQLPCVANESETHIPLVAAQLAVAHHGEEVAGVHQELLHDRPERDEARFSFADA